MTTLRLVVSNPAPSLIVPCGCVGCQQEFRGQKDTPVNVLERWLVHQATHQQQQPKEVA